jgi:UDP-3-O-[3-hydroxymyristoyl] glucosamine N-acyltransferase
MPASLGELATEFGCELIGDPDIRVDRVATLAHASPKSVGFFANSAYRNQLLITKAAAVVLAERDIGDCPVGALISDDPYATYARIARVLHPPANYVAGIHPSAVIADGVTISDSAHVSANVVIGKDCSIADGVYIADGCVVGKCCSIGRNSQLLTNATLVEDVRIGERTIIHPGAIIGSDGFGNAQDESGWIKIPQLGGVVIGNDVEIGANTAVDRGAIDDTVIEDGVRLDNLIQIGHNARIGEHTAIAGMTAIAGSVIIGKRCMIAGLAGVIGHVTVCDDVIITCQALITKDIREPGVYSATFGAEKDKSWKQMVARFRRSGALEQRVTELEAKVKKNDK